MAIYIRGDVYWYEFVFAGKRVRESAMTGSKTVAKESEKSRRRALERTLAGLPDFSGEIVEHGLVWNEWHGSNF